MNSQTYAKNTMRDSSRSSKMVQLKSTLIATSRKRGAEICLESLALEYRMNTMQPLVISSSGLSAYRRCPKSFQLQYEWGGSGLQYNGVPGYVTDGADFHMFAATAAKFYRGDKDLPEDYDDMQVNQAMYNVFSHWMGQRGQKEFEAMQEILHVDEEPILTLLYEVDWKTYGVGTGLKVYLRTTFDLVYRDTDDWIVIRDYKTFEKMPSLDADLDFQARGYIAAIMKKYHTRKVRFEHVYIRRVPPGTKNSRGFWSENECYVYAPIVIGADEAKRVWAEAQATVEAIVRTRELGGAHWWRTDLKGKSPFTCGSCFMKEPCKLEMETGELDLTTLELMNYVPREPLAVPEPV
jgi:hypothetical protein